MGSCGPASGFFGKLRSHGDFVGRRLPPSMRLAFDAWLQAALPRSQRELGAAWVAAWASSPLWRFVLAPGVCGERAWAGVMMPSADRVGRCFPLVLAAGMDGAPALRDCLTLHDGWFTRLEELALSSLDPGFALDAFDASLLALDGAPRACTQARARGQDHAQVTPLTAGTPPALADAALDGKSAWWTDGSAQVAPCLALCSGMPAPAAFAALLDGSWNERGWAAA